MCQPYIFSVIKDRKGRDLTEEEDIKKKWQEYTEELYKKILMTQITTMVARTGHSRVGSQLGLMKHFYE